MAPAMELFRQAMTAFQRGQLTDAERGFRQLLRKEPKHLAGLNILAIILTTTKNYAEAETYLKAALRVDATSDVTFYNYGIVLKALGRPDEALERFSQALAINPASADSWNNRGTVYNDLKDHARAIADFDRALAINPNDAGATFNKGKALAELKRHDEALAAYERALALRPDTAEAWFGLGALLHELRRHDDAARAYARALAINPQLPFLKGTLLHQKMLTGDWSGVADLIAEIDNDLAAGRRSAEPFSWQGVATSQKSLQLCAQIYSKDRFPLNVQTPVPRMAKADKIRIGYLSGEFREQATSLLLVGVLESHDRSRFDITAIDNGWDDGSPTRRRIAAAVDRIVGIRELGDPQAVTAIRDARIDVLVNLNGYFGEARTRVFARRAAPLQVNYLGFPGTLGADYMDYIVADRQVLPEAHREFYSEKVVWLPNSYQANDRRREISDRAFSRAECGLPATGVVFCCFNNTYKITPETFAGWMRIMAQVDGSVLWLIEDNALAAANMRRAAAAQGVDPQRIVFAGRLPPPEHLARHRCADLFLDTLPYNAHTTASDALWAGLPVLTCEGTTFAGRVAASLLHAVECSELITTSPDDYQRRAVALATEPEQLAALRRKLDANRLTTPLFDTQLFTRHLEAAYAAMVERHLAGLKPTHIAIAAD